VIFIWYGGTSGLVNAIARRRFSSGMMSFVLDRG